MRSGTERVTAYLLRCLREAPAGADAFVFPARKRIIASQLDLTQEHFSRILRALVAAGAIQVEGLAVRVLDRARLAALGTG